MQKEALVAQSVVILGLVGIVVWQRYHRTLKKLIITHILGGMK